ncbi:MAG TPA: M50 family metallopeptidase [Bacillota bacterium]|nr:M50 family metallopeptidase [Bacillota bacterium]
MQIGRVKGTKLLLNPYFLGLLIIYFLAGVILKAAIVFGLVFYHELFHVLTARSLGIRVSEIELLPFGGVARMDDLLELKPELELKVAVAGPLSNLLLLLAMIAARTYGLGSDLFWTSEAVQYLEKANILMLAFNLMPALPLDGGRIYRAFLVPRVGIQESTMLAAGMGKGLALVLSILGLAGLYFELTGLDFFIIAVFMFMATTRERARHWYVFLHSLTRKRQELFARGILAANVLVGEEDALVKDVVSRFIPGKYHLVVVLNRQQQSRGWLDENQLIEGLLTRGYQVPLAVLMEEEQ